MASSSTESISSHDSPPSEYHEILFEDEEPETPADRVRRIISIIDTGEFVEYVNVGRRSLGDEGLRELFDYLCRDEGFRCRVNSFVFDWTGADEGCLEAFAHWLAHDEHLETLQLRHDKIRWRGDEPIMLKLFSAINSSGVTTLIVDNRKRKLRVCDPFLISFVSQLDAPDLLRLDLDSFKFTSASTPVLISYLTSPRSRMLEYFGCSDGRFSRRLALPFLTALLKSNFTLSALSMNTSYIDTQPEDLDGHGFTGAKGSELLNRLKTRNKALIQKTQEEALLLLLCSRILLHYPTLQPRPGGSTQPDSQTTSVSPDHNSAPAPTPSFPFHALPVELRQYVLVFLTPALSHAQRLRVFASAASFPQLDTEPWLMVSAECQCGCDTCADSDESSDKGTDKNLKIYRSHAWERWLVDVECSRFEPPEGLTEADALRLL